MIPPQPASLRSALLCLKLQPALITPCSAAPSSTPIQRRFHSSTNQTAIHRPSTYKPIRSSHRQTIRLVTTTASPTTPNSPPSIGPQPLTWPTYFSLRRSRKLYNTCASLVSAFFTTGAGVSYLGQQPIENISVFGFDPIIVMGVTVMGSGAVGWLLGPTLGNAVFGLRHRGIREEMTEKEKDLYYRIQKHRVDVKSGGGSSANPVPDYYGEKILSVPAYRTWLKDQRSFNKKREVFLR